MKRYMTILMVHHDAPKPEWGYHFRMGDLDIDDEDVKEIHVLEFDPASFCTPPPPKTVKCGYGPCGYYAENPSEIEAEWFCSATHRTLAAAPVDVEPCPFPHVARFFVVREGTRSLVCQWIDMAQLGRSHSVIAETTGEQRAYEIARALNAELERQLERLRS